MPRDNTCISCGWAYHDEEVEGLYCVYCKSGLDGVVPADDDDRLDKLVAHREEKPDEGS
jgi:hypothetical protein